MKLAFGRLFRNNLISAIAVCILGTAAVCANTPTSWSLLKASSFGGIGDDRATAVKAGSDGSQYFTGRFGSSIQFGNTPLTSYGGQDIFITKVDPSGTVLWAIQAGGSSDDSGQALALDATDNIYVTGWFYNSATFGSIDGNNLLVNGGSQNVFLAKYNPSGVLAWVQTGVGSDTNDGYGVAVEPTTGIVYLTGRGQADMAFSSANGTHYTVPGAWTWHMFLVRYDTEGNFYWGETNAAGPNSMGYSVGVDKSGSAYVVGWLENTTTFYSQNGKDITITGFRPGQSDGNYPGDGFLVKYDSNGNAMWVNHFGGYKAIANAVAVGPTGEISLVGLIGNINYGSSGEASTIVTSQPPGQNVNLGGGDYTNPYNQDAIGVSYDDRGVLKKAVRIGGPANEIANGVTYDAGGLVYLTGVFQRPFNIGTRHLNGNNQQNVFLLQYSGTILRRAATAINAGVFSEGPGPGVSVDSNGNIFVVGTYQGTARFGDIDLSSAGGLDMFMAEVAVH